MIYILIAVIIVIISANSLLFLSSLYQFDVFVCVCSCDIQDFIQKSKTLWWKDFFSKKRIYEKARKRWTIFVSIFFFRSKSIWSNEFLYLFFFCSFINFHSLLWPLTLSSLFENVDCMWIWSTKQWLVDFFFNFHISNFTRTLYPYIEMKTNKRWPYFSVNHYFADDDDSLFN